MQNLKLRNKNQMFHFPSVPFKNVTKLCLTDFEYEGTMGNTVFSMR